MCHQTKPPPPDLLNRLEQQLAGDGPFEDIAQLQLGLSDVDAYRLQFALARRLAAKGDETIGYKAAYTAVGEAGGPRIGTLRQSHLLGLGDRVPLAAEQTLVEAEIAVRIAHDIEEAPANREAVASAIAQVMPAFEIVKLKAERRNWSRAHWMATHKIDGYVVLGKPHSVAEFDFGSERVAIDIDGTLRETGISTNVLGNPLNAVKFVAETLIAAGEALRAGAIVITGALTKPLFLNGLETAAAADFDTLGRLEIYFSQSA